MRNKVAFLLTTLFSVVLAPASINKIAAQDSWRKADDQVVRLAPTAFPELPRSISHKLISLGCSIPQAKEISNRHNVIRGNFKRPRQFDWAVLCSRKRVSSIIIFWAGSVRSPTEIAKKPDNAFLQTIDRSGTIGFSRTIAAADEKYILEHYREYNGPEPPPLNHQGIEDGFFDKASTIYYFSGSKWRELQGAD